MKSLKEYINETQYHSFGASPEDEKRAARAANKINLGWFDNKNQMKKDLMTYIVTNDIKNQISDSRVTATPVTSTGTLLKSKGFKSIEEIRDILYPIMKGRMKWADTAVYFPEDDPNTLVVKIGGWENEPIAKDYK